MATRIEFPSRVAPAPAAVSKRHEFGWIAVLVLAVLVSRGLLLGNRLGEPDSGLFTIGLWKWLRYGPHAPAIYGKDLSPGYYWFMAHLAVWTGTAPGRLPLLGNLVSFAAALGTAPLTYWISRRVLRPGPAFWSTLLFLLGPALWWLGVEPHPQGLALFLFLAALACALRQWRVPAIEQGLYSPADREDGDSAPGVSLAWGAASLLLTAGLLVRADLVLLFGAFPALLLWKWPRIAPFAALRRVRLPLLLSLLPAALASLLFLGLRSRILGESLAATQSATDHLTGGYFLHGLQQMHTGVKYLFAQALPAATGSGLLAVLLALGGIGVWLVRARVRLELERWLALILAWCVPGYLFWFLILGNNTRHVVPFILPLLWWGCTGWAMMSRRMLPCLAILALVLDPWTIPTNSNLTLYPSANVPGSARLLHQRQQEMQSLGRDMLSNARPRPALDRAPVCYLGSYTNPLVLALLLQRVDGAPGFASTASPAVVLVTSREWEELRLRTGEGWRSVRFYEVYSADRYRNDAQSCAEALSLEFTPVGVHRRYLGAEWTGFSH